MKSGVSREAKGVRKAMRKNILVWLFAPCPLLLALCFPSEAQQPAKVAKIGWLSTRPDSSRGSGNELFRRMLRQLGYVEGQNIAFEFRSAEGKIDRLSAMADELVRLKLDVLVASSTVEALAFKNATRIIPIVFYTSG